ncbi:hypothetical protein [Helicobacter sp. 'CLO3_human']|uniref:hypothetical protein n=1 Tax=Helicobacter sp. 'CLO3_human' TaxID=2020249 RepID=UPI003FA3C9B8
MLVILLFIIFSLSLTSCAKDSKTKYITESKAYASTGIDPHDIEQVVEKSARSLLESTFTKELKSRKMLAISDIINETQEDIDTEILSRKLVRHIRNSKKFTLTNAIAGSGAHTDKMLQKLAQAK